MPTISEQWRGVVAVMVLMAFTVVPALPAQEAAVKLAKAVYAEVGEAKGLAVRSKDGEDENGYPLAAKIWKSAAGVIRKMETVRSEDHGSETTEFYYTAEGKLVFAFQVVTTENIETGKVVARVEHRFYFDAKSGNMVQWLDSEKKPVPAASAEFADQETLVRAVESRGRSFF
jgi:hypothetical protein